MRLDGGDLGFDAAGQKFGRIPPRDKAQPVFRQQRFQRLRIVRPAVTVLDPVKADLGARLAQDLLGRDMGADGRVVVIRPGNGVGAIEDHGPAFS